MLLARFYLSRFARAYLDGLFKRFSRGWLEGLTFETIPYPVLPGTRLLDIHWILHVWLGGAALAE